MLSSITTTNEEVMRIYITFKPNHIHVINGETIDNRCIAMLECKNYEHGKEIAFELFSNKWNKAYLKVDKIIQDYPRGIIYIRNSKMELIKSINKHVEAIRDLLLDYGYDKVKVYPHYDVDKGEYYGDPEEAENIGSFHIFLCKYSYDYNSSPFTVNKEDMIEYKSNKKGVKNEKRI